MIGSAPLWAMLWRQDWLGLQSIERACSAFPISKTLCFMTDGAIDLWGLIYHNGWSKSLLSRCLLNQDGFRLSKEIIFLSLPKRQVSQNKLMREWLHCSTLSHPALCRSELPRLKNMPAKGL